ncbi:MAG: hypothetical protein IIB67_01685 [Proteobacteria bacterium]|nr:hypothetical protein [Pseudomonadota bacterium]
MVLEITLPSGATYPDWSCVTSPAARAALDAVFKIGQDERRWAGLDGDGERVRRAVLEAYRKSGHAPSIADLGDATGLDSDSLCRVLADLAHRDIVVAGVDDGMIAGAYPFVERSRGHRLRIAGVEINAMCAIDALGAGAMCGEDAVIDSACAHCGATIPSHSPTGKRTRRDTRFCNGTCRKAALRAAQPTSRLAR